MAAKGQQQAGKTGAFDPSKSIRASAPLPPGDPVRAAYEALISDLGVSGSEVVRRALLTLWQQRPSSPQTDLREAG